MNVVCPPSEELIVLRPEDHNLVDLLMKRHELWSHFVETEFKNFFLSKTFWRSFTLKVASLSNHILLWIVTGSEDSCLKVFILTMNWMRGAIIKALFRSNKSFQKWKADWKVLTVLLDNDSIISNEKSFVNLSNVRKIFFKVVLVCDFEDDFDTAGQSSQNLQIFCLLKISYLFQNRCELKLISKLAIEIGEANKSISTNLKVVNLEHFLPKVLYNLNKFWMLSSDFFIFIAFIKDFTT